MPRGVTGAALSAVLLAAAGPLAAQGSFCADSTRPAPAAHDLYCLDLVAVPGLAGAGGVVELQSAQTPFGLAVTPDGALRLHLVATIHGLPAPGRLGPYTTYVAWLADPGFASVRRLGAVRNGVVPLGESALDKFFIIVTAEASDTAEVMGGTRVLRGLSPSTRVGAHGIAAMAPALRGAPAAGHDHRAGPDAAASWRMPPMPAGFPMMPGLGGLEPPARPWLPAGGDAPVARPREVRVLRQGDSLTLTAGPVRKLVAGREAVLYGFNGQVPGPLLVVPEAATVIVTFVNHTALPTTIHWHGLRHDNRFDGVPHLTQEPVPPGGSFRYEVRFPDAGLYWYHPHHREDLLQDAGLAGNILVRARAADWLGPVHREEVLMLDDLLADDLGLLPWGEETPTHALMGRFGNVLLVNGEPRWELAVDRGDVVRLWFTNVSSTRTWNVSLPGTRMKAVASDLGRFDREEWVGSVVVGPAERYAVDVRFEAAGAVPLVNRVRGLDHIGGRFVPLADTLGVVTVRARGRPAPRPGVRLPPDPGRRGGGGRGTPGRAGAARHPRAGADARGEGPPLRDRADAPGRHRLRPPARVRRHDAGDGLAAHRRPGAMDPAGRGHRPRERRDPLAVPARRAGPAPAPERPERDPPDGAPDPPARPAVPRPGPERGAVGTAGVEGHRDRPGGRQPGAAGRDDQPREVDGALPHRRAPERGDGDGGGGGVS